MKKAEFAEEGNMPGGVEGPEDVQEGAAADLQQAPQQDAVRARQELRYGSRIT